MDKYPLLRLTGYYLVRGFLLQHHFWCSAVWGTRSALGGRGAGAGDGALSHCGWALRPGRRALGAGARVRNRGAGVDHGNGRAGSATQTTITTFFFNRPTMCPVWRVRSSGGLGLESRGSSLPIPTPASLPPRFLSSGATIPSCPIRQMG